MMNLSGRSFAYCLREIPPLAFTISAQVSIIFLNGATSDENGPVIETVTPTKMAAGALTWENTEGAWRRDAEQLEPSTRPIGSPSVRTGISDTDRFSPLYCAAMRRG